MQKITATIMAIGALIVVIAVGITFFLAPVSGSPLPLKTVNLTESANGTTIRLHVGDEIHIVLDENPTTGYQWDSPVPQAFTVIEDRFNPPEGSPMMGQGGIHTWVLKAVQKGTYGIHWMYKRSWESSESDRPFIVQVIIE